LAEKDYTEFAQMSAQSLQTQTELETKQQVNFDTYLESYYAQYRGCTGCGS
jgi:glutamate--cysteine ligase